jgi:hypothetical protein
MQSQIFASLQSKSAIVYYGDNISYPLVGIHDYIIIDPDYTKVHTTGFKTYSNNMYAYVSINEYHESRSYAKDIDKSWIIGSNSSWESKILNITDKGYQDFLLNKVIKKLHKKGFKNFFFDTMDSYQLANVSDKEKIYLRNGVINFIKRFKKLYPNSKLIVNRGFEMIDYIYPYLEAMLFESYYYGIDSSTMKYKEVSESDREWLDLKLKKVKKYHIPIIALDYIPHNEKDKIKKDIKALINKGFIPYIAEKELNDYGYSSKNPVQREVIIMYNGSKLENDYIGLSNSHLFASMPIEYFGYVPRLYDVNKPLPKGDLSNRFAGIIIWLETPLSNYKKLIDWVKYATDSGVKVLFLGDASIDLHSNITKKLGLIVEKNLSDRFSKRVITTKDPMFGYEIEPSIGYESSMVSINSGKALLSYKNSDNQNSTIAAIMPWGGFVFDNGLMSSYGENSIWVVNPFKLFKTALRLKDIPAPDPTTENGKRLAFLHLDGDASMNKVESNPKELSIERFLEHFIKKYTFPQSISIVESETAPHGKYPQYSKRLEAAAKKIYSYPYVETATHTYSHPYFWKDLEKDPTNEKYRTHLPRPYKFTMKREILGSLDYINNKLAKNNLHKNKLLFWTGDCVPSENMLEFTYKNGIVNINGGDTYISNEKPWMSLVQPLGIGLGEYYQIFTGEQNENVYTDDWRQPFWAFRKSIQTFNLTDKPRRLKPIDIYFHFYSVSKTASEESLKEVYDWIQKQDVMQIFTSQYPKKVTNFYDASLAHEKDSWLLTGFNDLRNVRVVKSMGIPDIKKSIGIVGYNSFNDSYYVHLDDKKRKILTLTKNKIEQNRLISANARLVSNIDGKMRFKSYMPIKLKFKLKPSCHLVTKPKVKVKKERDITTVIFNKNQKDVYVTQKCN